MSKKKGSISEEQIYRNRYIYSEYERLRATRKFACVNIISQHIAKYSTMPHHFLSDKAAKTIYYNYFHRKLPITYQCKKRLVDSFIESCEKVRDKYGISNTSAVIEMANSMPAPCCGLSASQVYRILKSMGAH